MVLQARQQLPSAAVEGEVYLNERLARHLDGCPCGEPICRLERALVKSPGRRVEIALKDYITYSRSWRQSPQANEALKTLAPARQKALLEFATEQHDRGRRSLDMIIGVIRDDLDQFEQMIPEGPKSVVTTVVATGYRAKQKIWQPYARQALALLDRGPTPLAIALGAAQAATGGRQRARLDLRELSAEEQAYVLHWFHHAARNLIRYRNGDPALPFEHPTCATACRDAVRPARLADPRTAT